MKEVQFDPAKFRKRFPKFGDDVVWSDDRLDLLFEMAKCFVWPVRWSAMNARRQDMAVYLMVAHLASIQAMDDAGMASSGIQTGATIDRVSVSLQAPPATSGWQHWLSTTPYGLQLWALLSVMAAGGNYVGAWPERQGFRKGGGVF